MTRTSLADRLAGRARVRSNIQNVLIITKARDNRLIKLTRELALYLMLRKRDNGRGLVVYVSLVAQSHMLTPILAVTGTLTPS